MTNKDTIAEMKKDWIYKAIRRYEELEQEPPHYSNFRSAIEQNIPKQDADIDAIMKDIDKLLDKHALIRMSIMYRGLITKHLTPKTTVPKDGEVKIGTKIWDDGFVKIISRLFTVSQENIENSNQNRREEVYVKFDGWSGDVSLSYIRQNCKILD